MKLYHKYIALRIVLFLKNIKTHHPTDDAFFQFICYCVSIDFQAILVLVSDFLDGFGERRNHLLLTAHDTRQVDVSAAGVLLKGFTNQCLG